MSLTVFIFLEFTVGFLRTIRISSCIYFLFWWSFHWYEWGVKVSYYYCVTVNLSSYVCKCLSYVLRCSYVGCISSVQSLSCVRLFVTPWIAACQASLSITNSQGLLRLMSIESVMPSSHLILCCPLLLLPSICPSIRVFSNESVLHIRWWKYWSFSFSISPSSEYSGLISFRTDWMDLLAVQGTLKSLLNTTVQKYQFAGAQHSF